VRDALLATLVLVIASAGCARPEESAVRPEDVMDFNTLFKTNCAGCHGTDGRQGVAQQLNDPLFLAVASDASLRDVISNGRPGTPMTAFARESGGLLTREQVQALVDGMKRSWGGTPPPADSPPPPYSEDEAIAKGLAPGEATRGRSAFASYCARCHGADGKGGTSGGSVVDDSFLALTSSQSLRTTIIAGHAAQGISGWRYAEGRPMTPQEISDLVAWLSTHRGNP
jgi:mono/diheme cytochrome c family protein